MGEVVNLDQYRKQRRRGASPTTAAPREHEPAPADEPRRDDPRPGGAPSGPATAAAD
jgi:hypothetical protein